jgi:ABC-2 type transport system ATP-binding protein
MYEGQIHQIGTPAELRGSLGAKRLELRTPSLGAAEQLLARISGPDRNIIDAQRFGDRVDVLVRAPDQTEREIRSQLEAAHIPIEEIRLDEPLLENTFVARLRTLGHDVRHPDFPGLHAHHELKGGVAIGATGLTKQFGSFRAVKDVTLQVRYGEVYGLLGANGAGKTTTIKMLCGLLDPTRGRAELAGEQHDIRSADVRERVGYMSQKFSLYDDLSIEENLAFFAGVYGVPESEKADKMRWVLEFASLEGKAQQLVGSLPGGWKQRVAFGASIMHEPSVLFLDEPTSGVDPVARRIFWGLINRLADAGTAILVTTHYLEEAEQCNRLGLMVAGELVAEGTPSGIKSAQRGHLLELTVDQPQRATDRLKTVMDRWRVSLFGDRLHIITGEDLEAGQRLVRETLQQEGIQLIQTREARFSLEDVFISVVEQAREQGKVAVED